MALANNSVFISYRKDDAGGWAAKLASDLRAIVSEDAVFLDDSAGIPYGAHWPDRISVALDQCRVFLPVIAPSWHREPNLSRLKEPDDWVRKELITAHSRQSSVLCIPVFVNEASVLDPDQFSADAELHAVISSLMKQQGLQLDRNPEYWKDKLDGLGSRIEEHLGIDISRQFESSEHGTTKTGGDLNFHRSLNVRQGMMVLVGVAIAAGAWCSLRPNPDASGPNITLVGNQSEGDITTTITINNIDPTVEKLVANLSKQLDVKDDQLDAKEQQISELTKAVAALVSAKDEPNAPEGIEAALDALSKGDSEQAEIIFQSIADTGEAESRKTAEVYRHLGALAFLHDIAKALNAYRRSTELDPSNIDGWNSLGHLLHLTGDLDGAIAAYEQLFELGEVDSDTTAVAYTNLGMVYRKRGELDKAEVFYHKALQIVEKLGSKEGMATSYSNLGTVYETRGGLGKAEEFHLKALQINEALGHQQGMATSYSNLGTVYYKREDLDKAEEFYLKALQINEALGHQQGMAFAYGNLGNVYKTRGELDKTREYWERALSLFENIGAESIARTVSSLIEELPEQ